MLTNRRYFKLCPLISISAQCAALFGFSDSPNTDPGRVISVAQNKPAECCERWCLKAAAVVGQRSNRTLSRQRG